MAQCPLCKRNAAVEAGRCARCQGDVTVLQAARDLPAHLYNAGLEAARNGDSLSAIVKVAAASELGNRPEPWIVLGKLFANEGALEHAEACFSKAEKLGGAVPEVWASLKTRRESEKEGTAVAEAARPRDSAWFLWLRGLPFPALVTRFGLIMALLVSGIGAGWIIRGYQRHETQSIVTMEDPEKRSQGEALASASADSHRDAGSVLQNEPKNQHQILGKEDSQGTPLKALSRLVDSPVSKTEPPAEGGRYKVKEGDSLWRIAKSHLGTGERWPVIYAVNQKIIENPDRLLVGQLLVIPGREELK